MDAPLGPVQHATSLLGSTPESLHPHLQQFLANYQRRLWHPLALSALRLAQLPEAQPHLPGFLKQCILPVEDRLDTARFVDIAVLASHALSPKDAAALMDDVANRLAPPRPHALPQHVRALATAATHLLRVPESVDLKQVRHRLTTCERHLDSLGAGKGALGGVPPEVHAAFYQASGALSRRTGDWDGFYASGMLYLACMDVQTLSKDDKLSWVNSLCVAAIASKNVYIFGDLLGHALVRQLEEETGEASVWRLALAKAMHRGDHAAYTRLSVHFPEEVCCVTNRFFLAT